MEITLLRHATRDFTLGDVPLNQKGMIQAEELVKQAGLNGMKTIISSPKLRAKMTVAPLAQALYLEVQIDSNLDQMSSTELGSSFNKRVQTFIEEIAQPQKHPSPLLICTHSDWLDCALRVIPSDELHLDHQIFQCADHLSFVVEQGLWKLKRNTNL